MIKVTIEDMKPSKKKLHIEVPVEKVEEKKDKIISALKKSAKIKGFRKGKVPKDVIIKTYKKDIDEDTQRELVSEAYDFAISDNKLQPVSELAVTNVVFEDGKPFSFDVLIDVKPEFELKEYKNIEIEKEDIEITKEEKDNVLNQIVEAFSALEEKKGDKGAEEGDVFVLDIETINKDDGTQIKELTGKNIYGELGKKLLIEEIEKEIYGMKQSETKEVEVSFDKDYPLRYLKGKNVKFKITLTSLKTKIPPELNDEFATKVNKEFKTVDDLMKDIENRLKKNKEFLEIERQKDAIVEKFIKDYDFELPETLVNQEVNSMMVEYVKDMYYKGADVNSEEYKPQNLRGKFEENARKRVKTTFILLKIAEKENIDVSNDEIKDFIAKEAASKNMKFDDLYKEYQEKNLLPIIQMDILGDKTLDFLLKEAKLVEPKKEDTKEEKK